VAKPVRRKAKSVKAAKSTRSKARRAAPAKTRSKVRRAAPAKRASATRPQTKKAPADGLRALARRIVDVTLSNDDEAAFALYASDVESIEPGQPPMRGVDAIRQKFAGWHSMTSAARFEPRRVCVDGDTIVIEWVGDVTLAATGKQVRLHEVALHEIRDGKISREIFFYDPSTFA
jgi:ketosteroid isomerase-like protein